MDNKKKMIIIGIIILIIVGAIIVMLTTTVNYERTEITPNGTSIDIPTNKAKYQGDIAGVKIWNWNNGALVTYNSQETNDSIELSSLGFNTVKELATNGNSETIDGFTVYTVNTNKLLDIAKININGKFYCIYLNNETTHDNIVICCNDKDVTLHMAQSVEYKKMGI